jgi:hypothetical protein
MCDHSWRGRGLQGRVFEPTIIAGGRPGLTAIAYVDASVIFPNKRSVPMIASDVNTALQSRAGSP